MKIEILKTFGKDLKKVKEKTLLKKIADAVIDLKAVKDIREVQQIKKLKGYGTAYRLRIGVYRIGLFFEDEEIILSRFAKCEDIYKKFP